MIAERAYSMMKRNRHVLLILILLASITGCTHAVKIEIGELEAESAEIDQSGEKEYPEKVFQGDYIFQNNNGERISPTKFFIRDSSFVVLEQYQYGSSINVDSLTIPIKEVKSIEKIVFWKGPTIVIVTVTGLAIGFVLLMCAVIPNS